VYYNTDGCSILYTVVLRQMDGGRMVHVDGQQFLDGDSIVFVTG
jgi:hypothetical protein